MPQSNPTGKMERLSVCPQRALPAFASGAELGRIPA